jgi:predicted nucleotidyltransferase
MVATWFWQRFADLWYNGDMKRSEALRKLNAYAGAIKALGATSLYLFGSTAHNKADAGSDIDLFIDCDPRGRFSALDLVAAKRLLEAGLGVEVDPDHTQRASSVDS